MKIWYLVRRPIGYALMSGLFYLFMIAIHALPILVTNAILGIER